MRRLLLAVAIASAGCAAPPAPVECDDADHTCLQGIVTDFLQSPLPGAELCVMDHEEIACATTAENGAFTLPGLPLQEDIVVLQRKDGYQPTAYPLDSAQAPAIAWAMRMLPDSLVETQRNAVNEEVQPGTGGLFFELGVRTSADPLAWTDVEGATVEVSPGDGGDLYYLNVLYMPDADLTSTTGVGFVGVMNLEPGDYEVVATAPAGDCTTEMISWAFEPGDPVPALAIDGFATYFSIGCPG